MTRIYLDCAATTPLAPEVLNAMLPWLSVEFGNASSLHLEGRRARQAIDEAREIVARKLGAEFAEVLFVGSATEAANMALVGYMRTVPHRRKLLVSAIEHECIRKTAQSLEQSGVKVIPIDVDRSGLISLEHLRSQLDGQVALVAVMHANNETGALQPVVEVVDLCKKAGVKVLIDAVQTFTKFEWSVRDWDADFVLASGHKIHGPKGVGVLYMKAATKIQPLIQGGGQEREQRAGTENVAAIVGMAAAVKHARPLTPEARDAFVSTINEELPEGWNWTLPPDTPRLPSHAHAWINDVLAESVLIKLDRAGISASSGAACSAGSIETSHVMQAMGFDGRQSRSGLRFTFDRNRTVAEAQEAAARVQRALAEIRESRR